MLTAVPGVRVRNESPSYQPGTTDVNTATPLASVVVVPLRNVVLSVVASANIFLLAAGAKLPPGFIAVYLQDLNLQKCGCNGCEFMLLYIRYCL